MGIRLKSQGAALLFVISFCVSSQGYDTIIRGARVLDGTSTPWYRADVAITTGRIVAMGKISLEAPADQTIDATGLYLAPGFIDPHSHAWPFLGEPKGADAAPLLLQGVTTVFVNPDGGGPTDLNLQRKLLEKQPPGINVAQYIGHNSIRIEVLGYANRAPNPDELAHMAALVRRGMEAGAFGLSAGPFYTPGNFSNTDEHIALAKVAAEFDGVYTSHIRDEGNYNVGLRAAVDEVIQVAREARLPGIVTHIKSLGPEMWGTSAAVIREIDAARAAGVQVFADQYPYTASSTSLAAALLPPWALEGGRGALTRRLSQAPTLARIQTEMTENLARRGGPHSIQIATFGEDRSVQGKRLDDLARAHGVDPVEEATTLLRAGDPSIISYNMSEADVRAFMVQPWTMTCSDGRPVLPGQVDAHPRAYGTFPRKIGTYVVEQKLLTLEQAIHSMTGMPATILRMKDRGVVRVGAWADLVVFDLAAVHDRATYDQPTLLAEGMRTVMIAGRVAVSDGRVTMDRAGRVLSRLKPDY